MRTLGILPILLLLSACGGGIGETLGLDRSGPDEYNIAPQAPLAIPPDFSLRPPEPGAPRPQAVSAETKAKAALLGTTVTENSVDTAMLGNGSSAEQAVLDRTKNYATRGSGDSIPQPEAMRVLSTPEETAAETPPASMDETLKKVVDAPTTDGSAITLKQKDKPFWDSWF